MDDIPPPIPEASTRFIHLLRRDMRDKGYAYKTEKTYVHWVARYIRFHGKRHPQKLKAEHVNQFLSYLANEKNCAPATQRIALNALSYLYRKFLHGELGQLAFEQSRLNELLSLRVKDLGFELSTLTVRSGKGDKDRTTLLPQSLKESLQKQVKYVEKLHRRDIEDGYDIRTIQKLLGHSDVRTTEIYTHVLGRGAMGVISPADS